MEAFSEWLNNELVNRDWSQSDLARQAGLTSAAISRIISGQRGPGPEALIAIAEALKLPPEHVFRQAGLLPEDNGPESVSEKIIAYKAGELTESQRDEVIQFIEFIQNRDERPDRRTPFKVSEHDRRESAESSPEVLKDD